MKAEMVFTRQKVIRLLSLTDFEEQQALFKRAYSAKVDLLGKKVHLRGLIEISNQCRKNCLYCGIRSGNATVLRYSMTDEEILKVVDFARSKGLTGVVLQAGERNDAAFIFRITALISKIKQITEPDFRITLSLGEQLAETYHRWFDAGVQRYLLRIETSDKTLYQKIHPNDDLHSFETRLNCLESIQQAGFQTGTGVMIGLPGQTMENLADDLFFIQQKGIDMVGMGPYIEHEDTPLYEFRNLLKTKQERFDLALKMVATLRLLMPDINIAAATALQAIDRAGREKALSIGANILMPNLTPTNYRKEYQLYEDKPCIDEDAELCKNCLEARIEISGCEIGYGEWGDSKHFLSRN